MKTQATPRPLNLRQRIYFSHYGYIWSLSYFEAIDLVKNAIEKGEWNFKPYRELSASRPKIKYRIYECLDWQEQDWKDCLRDIYYSFGLTDDGKEYLETEERAKGEV